MIEVFFDTNIYYSALITPVGTAALLIEMASQGLYKLFVTQEVLDELAVSLNRPKAKKILGKEYSIAEIKEYVESFSKGFIVLEEVLKIKYVKDDPKDDHIINAAVCGQVDFLVSGDKKHILPMKDHPQIVKQGIHIVSPSEFVEIIKDKFLK
jgi:putative PIN family toxin of toxin-antitoxin system